jgi:hypothetical protein
MNPSPSRPSVASIALMLVGVFCRTAPVAAQETFTFKGALMTRALRVESQPTWLEGGFGRLSEGAESAIDSKSDIRGLGHIGLDWRPGRPLLLRVHALGRSEPESYGGERLGVTEAFLQYRPELSVTTALRLRAGLFFAGTSRENIDPLWASPYTLTFSALNSWIAEEVRPTGAEAMLQTITESGHEFELGGSMYRGMDTSGTLLAWRGWSMHDRMSVLGEILPLPPLPTLSDSGMFFRQRDDGTGPLHEIDDHLGWYGRARWSKEKVGLLQGAYFDNGGDRELYEGQYSWETTFWLVGGELQLHPSAKLVAEGTQGKTMMGPGDVPPAYADFRAGYVLLALGDEKARLSARYDRFETTDEDGGGEPNDETGSALTIALMMQVRERLRVGIEFLDLKSQRPAAAFSGFDPNTDARQVSVELRTSF